MSTKASPTGAAAVKELIGTVEKHAGVVGVIAFENESAQVVYTTLTDRALAKSYADTAHGVCRAANKGLQEITERDRTRLIRLRSFEHELVIKPDEAFTLVVVQDPSAPK